MVIPWDLRSPTLRGRFQLDRRLRRVLGKSDRFTASVQGKREALICPRRRTQDVYRGALPGQSV